LLSVVGAIVAVVTPNLLYSVISVGAVGFLLAIAFLLLSAPDLAVVQIGVESICLVLLLRATLGREVDDGAQRPLVGVAFAVALVAGIGLFGLQVFYEFPEFGIPAMERFQDAAAATYLATGAETTGAPNIVTAVLLDFRGWDTLGEGTVLFCAVLGATAIMRRRARRKDDASQ
jgi:multisubunit Na+/H+ antiporter MnhB subunit